MPENQPTPQEIINMASQALGPVAVQESAVVGSGAMYLTLGGDSRHPRDIDIVTSQQAYRYLREQPGWQESHFADGQPVLRNGKLEVAMGAGWPNAQMLRQNGWTTQNGLAVAGLSTVYAWKQGRGTLKDMTDNRAIQERLHDPGKPPLPPHVMPYEMQAARTILPENLRDDPDAQAAIHLTASGLYITNTLYGDPRTGRCNQIIGTLERPEEPAIATYHNGFDLVRDGQLLQKHFDNIPGITKEQRQDGAVADAYSDSVYGNGRESDKMPGGHDELRSARLARAHAISVGLPPERADRIGNAIEGTGFDEKTKTQKGRHSTDPVARGVVGVDLQVTSEPGAVEACHDLASEDGTSKRFSEDRYLGKIFDKLGVVPTSTEEAMAILDANPNVRPDDSPNGPTAREWVGNRFLGSSTFHDPQKGYQAPDGWTLTDPQIRTSNSQELKRVGQALIDGEINLGEAYRQSKAYNERLRAEQAGRDAQSSGTPSGAIPKPGRHEAATSGASMVAEVMLAIDQATTTIQESGAYAQAASQKLEAAQEMLTSALNHSEVAESILPALAAAQQHLEDYLGAIRSATESSETYRNQL